MISRFRPRWVDVRYCAMSPASAERTLAKIHGHVHESIQPTIRLRFHVDDVETAPSHVQEFLRRHVHRCSIAQLAFADGTNSAEHPLDTISGHFTHQPG